MSLDDSKRFVVTGMGTVTVAGESLKQFWSSLVEGRSGITRWKKAMGEACYSKIGGDMSDFDLEAHLARVGASYPGRLIERTKKMLRVTPLSGRLTAAASVQACVDAGLPDSRIPPERFGHVLAADDMSSNYVVENTLTYFHEEPDYIEPLMSIYRMQTDTLGAISEILDLKGSSFTVGGACASGNLAIMAGLDLLRLDRVEAVLVSGGAVEADPVSAHSWAMADAISYKAFNDQPAKASRPFDANREGFVPSEGSGALVIETLARARSRGARVYAEVLGAASSSDASRLPKREHEGQVRAIRAAMREARVAPESVDYVNAHATSTPLGDVVEVTSLKEVLGEHARRIPINSTKSIVGHLLTAAGVVELVATVLQMERRIVHPTINQETSDPELDLDFVPNRAREHEIRCAISNSFGFGGMNACVVVGRAP